MAAVTVLVVEDEAIVALDIERTLRKQGYLVEATATTGEEAISLAERCRPDVLVMDVRLRGEMDGIEAARRIRQERNVPVVFLTAFSDRDTLQRAKEAEPFAYLLKPFDEATLTTNIEIALHRFRTESSVTHPSRNAQRFVDAHFDQLMQHVKDYGIQLLDAAGQIRSWSPGAEQIYGWSAAETLGKSGAMLYPPIGEEVEPDRELNTAARTGLYSGYVTQVGKDQSRFPAELLILALTASNGIVSGFLKITRKVTPGETGN